MKRLTTRTAAASAVLVLGSLAGCSGGDSASENADDASESSSSEGSSSESGSSESGGGSESSSGASTEEYCTALKAAEKDFEGLDGGGADGAAGIQTAFDTMRELSQKAPDEVATEWQTLVSGLDDFEQAVADAGLTFEQLAELPSSPTPQNLPEGVTPEKLQQLTVEVQKLQDPQVSAAQGTIDANAEKECGVTLGGGSGEQQPE